eukprot:CAMPEP_0171924476 /NCGR_PEP_ID=MMETSP0993-20121228/23014_1 /TAXON_ID=483369 /ORGANISM="non described non described, Strain CCMP2098" /LENGTH=138 /DNA_ID=CAMNT_0012562739 /DNA_START=386 /DNA_END=802 /DNA_ORIENTATION=-
MSAVVLAIMTEGSTFAYVGPIPAKAPAYPSCARSRRTEATHVKSDTAADTAAADLTDDLAEVAEAEAEAAAAAAAAAAVAVVEVAATEVRPSWIRLRMRSSGYTTVCATPPATMEQPRKSGTEGSTPKRFMADRLQKS